MSLKAPIAKKIAHIHDKHGHQRIDNYHWMTERDAPEVLDYLKKENGRFILTLVVYIACTKDRNACFFKGILYLGENRSSSYRRQMPCLFFK